jgi:hypothetical protein
MLRFADIAEFILALQGRPISYVPLKLGITDAGAIFAINQLR